MKGWKHIFFALIVFIPLAAFTDFILWGDCALAIIATNLPDTDWAFDSHRNVLFHSIFFPLLTLFGTESGLEYAIILSVSLHLLLDIRIVFSFAKERPGGNYLIRGILGSRWKYHFTNMWLFFNAIIGIFIFLLKILGVMNWLS